MATQSPEKARGEEGGGRALSSNLAPKFSRNKTILFLLLSLCARLNQSDGVERLR